MQHIPISQEVIESMINRHTRPNFKIGDLYHFTVSNGWGRPETVELSPLLDYSMVFDYRGYYDLCRWGKSLPKGKYTFVPGTHDQIKPYTICFSYSFLSNNKIQKREIKSEFYDPIYHNQTMHSKISIFCYECIKVVNKYEDQ